MKILALDIATNTGVAVGENGSAPVCWSESLGQAPDERRFSNVLRLLDRLIDEHKPDLIAIEAAIGGKHASQYLIGLVACVRGCAYLNNIQSEVYYLASIRKHFLGKALSVRDFPAMTRGNAKRAIKKAVMDRCALLGWKVSDDDAADAAALWDYAMSRSITKYHAAPSGELFHAR